MLENYNGFIFFGCQEAVQLHFLLSVYAEMDFCIQLDT